MELSVLQLQLSGRSRASTRQNYNTLALRGWDCPDALFCFALSIICLSSDWRDYDPLPASIWQQGLALLDGQARQELPISAGQVHMESGWFWIEKQAGRSSINVARDYQWS